MPFQKIEPEPSYVEAKIVVLIVMVVAGLGLAGGYIIFLPIIHATEPVLTVNLTKNVTTQFYIVHSNYSYQNTSPKFKQPDSFRRRLKIQHQHKTLTPKLQIQVNLLPKYIINQGACKPNNK